MKHAAAILLCTACAVSFSHAQDEAISISGNLTRALAELKQQEIDAVSEMFADMRDGHDDQDGQLP